MSVHAGVKSFLLEKFWKPIANESVFYNPYNTAVYSGLFALAAAYIGFPLLKKMDVDLDRDFFTGIAPYIFLGGASRSLKDINAVNTVLLETPFIYILMFFFTVSALFISRKLEQLREIDYHKTFGAIGLASLLMILPFYSLNNFPALVKFLSISIIWISAGYAVLDLLKPELKKWSFALPIAAHFFDATSTVTALSFGGVEKHVLAGIFIENFGPYGMFLMKSLIIIPAVYYIHGNMEGEERNYYLFLIALLGFALATRNMLSLVTV